MTISVFTHFRRLDETISEFGNIVSHEFLPEIEILLNLIASELACVRFDSTVVEENCNGRARWFNTTTLAFNKHIVVINTETTEQEWAHILSYFSEDRPFMPYGYDLPSYVSNVESRKAYLIDQLQSIDTDFDSGNILQYISNFQFVDEYYISIQDWIINIINNNNILYPNILLSNNLWNLSSLIELNNRLSLESNLSDIKKMLNAFEIFTMNTILEVV